jgi:hypothetical protein
MSRTFNAVSTLTKARNGELSVDELRKAVADALDFGKSDVAFELQAILEQRTGLRLKPTAKENSLTNAWLAAGVKGVRNIQYSWSAIADDGVPVFTVWSQYLPDKQLRLWAPTDLSDKAGYADRRQHALVGIELKGGKARAFEIRGLRRGDELAESEKSRVEAASLAAFEARVERRGEELWLVWP